MVNGVVSLRCPACSRPFISLPQRAGALVTCPHCARSAPIETYGAAAGTLGRAVACVPIQKRVISAKPTSSAFASASGQEAVSAPKVWPRAPEQAPQFTPQTHPVFPTAPITPVWPTAPVVPMPSPFSLAASETPLTVAAPAVVPSPPAAMPTSGPVLSATTPDLATWPTPIEHPLAALRQSVGVSASVQSPPSISASPFHALNEPEAHPGDSSESADLGWRSAHEERNVPLGLWILFLMGLCGWLTWAMSGPGMVAEFAAPIQPRLLRQATPQPVVLNENETATPLAGNAASGRPQPAISEPEGHQAVEVPALVRLNLVEARKAAQNLLAKLFDAETQDARIEMVAEGEDYAWQIADFFKNRSLKLESVAPAAFIPRSLPGQELVPVMEVKTNLNAQPGARLQMRAQTDGTFVLEWPLFEETHEGRLAEFLALDSTEPVWLSVILKRSHAVELAETIRKEYFCVSLEGSGDDANRCLALVPVETPLARFFEREVEWGEVYATRLLLQRREVAGRKEVVILDCEGAVTGAIFPSGSGR